MINRQNVSALVGKGNSDKSIQNTGFSFLILATYFSGLRNVRAKELCHFVIISQPTNVIIANVKLFARGHHKTVNIIFLS